MSLVFLDTQFYHRFLQTSYQLTGKPIVRSTTLLHGIYSPFPKVLVTNKGYVGCLTKTAKMSKFP